MEYSPLVSVVIATAGRAGIIDECLSNLHAQTYELFEILIVDSSMDNQTEELVKKYPRVKYFKSLIRNTPVQRNAGIEKSNGEIIAFIDDDSIVERDWLSNMVKEYEQLDVASVGGLVIEEDSANEKSHLIGKISKEGKFIANFHLEGESGKTVVVDHLKGCNMSFRKSVFLETGMFDPEYKGTCFAEETDMCIRVAKRKYKVVFSPNVKVKHLASHRPGYSRDRYNMNFQYYYARNKMYFFVKNYGLSQKTVNFIVLDTLDHFQSYLKRIVVGIIHTCCLIALNIFGKAVGACLACRKRR